jgi:hypothetical protein
VPKAGVWGAVRGFHPRLLNLLPSGEDAAARAETSPSGKHGLPA